MGERAERRLAERGVLLLRRGWLHGNIACLPGPPPGLIDTGYHSGLAVLLDWLRPHAPADIGLTHVHSDHAGGVAGLVARTGARVLAHLDAADLVERWDRRGLWLEHSGQELPRFRVDRPLRDGEELRLGGRSWRVHHVPGHATGGLAWESEDGLLLTGDALWEDGLGMLHPWVDGEGVFAAAARALDRLEGLQVRAVVPGHGAPFCELQPAVDRARRRLEALRADPERHRRHVLLSLAAFARLAHPGWGPAELAALLHEATAAWPPRGPGSADAELCQKVLERLL